MSPLHDGLQKHESYQDIHDLEQASTISNRHMVIDRNLDQIGTRWSQNGHGDCQKHQKVELSFIGLYE